MIAFVKLIEMKNVEREKKKQTSKMYLCGNSAFFHALQIGVTPIAVRPRRHILQIDIKIEFGQLIVNEFSNIVRQIIMSVNQWYIL